MRSPSSSPPWTATDLDATVKHVCCDMRDRRAGAVLVIDKNGSLVGIFTGRDAATRVAAAGKDSAKTRLHEVMTRDPYSMPPDKTAIDALWVMQDRGFRHVLVVDNDKLLGVVSRGDFRGLEEDRLDEERCSGSISRLAPSTAHSAACSNQTVR